MHLSGGSVGSIELHVAWGTSILHKLRDVCQVFPSIFSSMRSLLQIIALATLSQLLGVAGAPTIESEPALVKRGNPQGCDVSNHQGSLHWATIKSQGAQFTYIKATEGTS